MARSTTSGSFTDAIRQSASGPRASASAGWALLPLRGFLGVTFVYASLQKLANPNFLDASSPISIQSQLIGAARSSPIHVLLSHLIQVARPLGVLIALGELAVGLGVLVGLWTRIAALGGMAISASLFLTVSFHASPYFTGSDIVFFFAWSPLVIAGAGGVLSLDAVLGALALAELGATGKKAGSKVKPVQRGAPVGTAPVFPWKKDEVSRRTFVLQSGAAAAAAVAGVAMAGAAAGGGRAAGGAKSAASNAVTLPPAGTTTTSTSGSVGPQPAGTAIGRATVVPVGGSGEFTDPASQDPGIVLQRSPGVFVAFDAVCPHAGCTVAYQQSADLIVCPCHGSEFNPETGAHEAGPAPHGLRVIPVAKGSDGKLYVDG